jgi:hypothetical protein
MEPAALALKEKRNRRLVCIEVIYYTHAADASAYKLLASRVVVY